MPEGPSLIIFKEELQQFVGKTVTSASGSIKSFDISMLEDKKLKRLKTWGKHLLCDFGDFTMRIHFLMFGVYYINSSKDKPVRLYLEFDDGSYVNFYSTAHKLLEGTIEEVYDWKTDVMSEEWDEKTVAKKIKSMSDRPVCDVLLDQDVFTGVGNIIKNEVLFLTKIHPLTQIGDLPPKKRKELIETAVSYTYDFLDWKREGTLRSHWQAHRQKTCPRDHIPFHKDYLGENKRQSFWCEECQKRYE